MVLNRVNIKTAKLFEWQEAVVRTIFDNPHDIVVFSSKRQIGKSVAVEQLLLHYAINKRLSTSMVVSPTLNQSRKIYKELRNAIVKLPIYDNSNSQTLEIGFWNGSQILFRSAEQGEDALRGYTINGILCFDEASFIKDELIYHCLPMVDANKAPVLLTSTPKFKSGVFYDWYNKGLEGEQGFHTIDANNWDTSILLPKERLEMYRKALPPLIFRSEYQGLFIDAVSSVFGDIEKCCSDTLKPYSKVVMGLDWGSGSLAKSNDSDSTAVVLMNEHRQVIKCFNFNDKDERETIDFICDVIKEYNVTKILAETNSMGAVYVNLLRKQIGTKNYKCVLQQFTTTQQSKADIIQALQVHFQNGTIEIPNDNLLKLQLVAYEAHKSANGKLSYEGGNGNHDDLIIALALANKALQQGNTKLR